jgi:hypothetical protein
MEMSKRLAGIFILCAILAPAVLPCAAANVKGKGQQGGQAQVTVKLSMQIANFPLPFAAELVAGNKQKAPRGWTEYRVIGFSASTLMVFYRQNMPGHGWKLGHYKGNTWVWLRGRRSLTVIFVQSDRYCLIQVRETVRRH